MCKAQAFNLVPEDMKKLVQGLTLCDKALTSCNERVKFQDEMIKLQDGQIKNQGERIIQLETQADSWLDGKILWFVLGGVTSGLLIGLLKK